MKKFIFSLAKKKLFAAVILQDIPAKRGKKKRSQAIVPDCV